jgi:Na+/melibiose symporter-like transporter
MAAYFANSNLGNENLTTVILAATIIPLLAVVPFLPKLIQAFGKRKLTIICPPRIYHSFGGAVFSDMTASCCFLPSPSSV